MMQDEFVLVVDESDEPLEPQPRSEVLKHRLWRRTGGGIAVDRKGGQVLCHRRSLSKDERPGVWVATFGGKSAPGESPVQTARRELFEEFGIDLDDSEFAFFGRVKSVERRQFEYLFVVDMDAARSHVSPDIKEIAEYAWLNLSAVVSSLRAEGDWFSYGYDADMLEVEAKRQE